MEDISTNIVENGEYSVNVLLTEDDEKRPMICIYKNFTPIKSTPSDKILLKSVTSTTESIILKSDDEETKEQIIKHIDNIAKKAKKICVYGFVTDNITEKSTTISAVFNFIMGLYNFKIERLF